MKEIKLLQHRHKGLKDREQVVKHLNNLKLNHRNYNSTSRNFKTNVTKIGSRTGVWGKPRQAVLLQQEKLKLIIVPPIWWAQKSSKRLKLSRMNSRLVIYNPDQFPQESNQVRTARNNMGLHLLKNTK